MLFTALVPKLDMLQAVLDLSVGSDAAPAGNESRGSGTGYLPETCGLQVYVNQASASCFHLLLQTYTSIRATCSTMLVYASQCIQDLKLKSQRACSESQEMSDPKCHVFAIIDGNVAWVLSLSHQTSAGLEGNCRITHATCSTPSASSKQHVQFQSVSVGHARHDIYTPASSTLFVIIIPAAGLWQIGTTHAALSA